MSKKKSKVTPLRSYLYHQLTVDYTEHGPVFELELKEVETLRAKWCADNFNGGNDDSIGDIE